MRRYYTKNLSRLVTVLFGIDEHCFLVLSSFSFTVLKNLHLTLLSNVDDHVFTFRANARATVLP